MTKRQPCNPASDRPYIPPLKGIFTDLDGVAFALFHGEHSAENGCRFRWRIRGDLPPAYLAWREVEAAGPFTIVRPEVSLSEVEAQWWDAGAGEWRQVTLLRLARGICSFQVTAKVDLDLPQGFTVVAPMGERGVASYLFPALRLAAGDSVEVRARPDGCALANLLIAAGEFRTIDPAMEVVNLSASTACWSEAPAGEPAILAPHPAPPPNYFAVAGERVAIPTIDL